MAEAEASMGTLALVSLGLATLIVLLIVSNPAALLRRPLALTQRHLSGKRGLSKSKQQQSSYQNGSRKITRAEVAKHNKRDDCWLVIDGKVYDVSEYVAEHPGGDSILKNAGSDSSAGFHGPQHPPRVHDLVEDYRIGDLLD
jgi:cytochrome b involved in lipid metabolism